MIPIVGSVFVIVGCSAIGMRMVKRMKNRIWEMYQMRYYLLVLRGEIKYGKRNLVECFRELEKKSKGCWHGFFENLVKELEGEKQSRLADIWEKSMKMQLYESCLREEQKKEWLQLGQNLGYLDTEMQIAWINVCEERILDNIRKEKEQYNGQAKLYQTLGVMCGVFLVIVLI